MINDRGPEHSRLQVGETIRLLRPHQWVKNGFVFTGFLFVKGWHDSALTLSVVVAACAFSLVASGIYIFNDLGDRERDRLHPEKRFRPLPSGTVSPVEAGFLMVVTAAGGLALGYWVSATTFLFLSAYIIFNILYTHWLKQVVILDVFVLAAGFILRILVGTLGVGIPPSKWLLLCGIMLALFLGFGKRQAELMAARSTGQSGREVLEHYSDKILDGMLTTTSAAVLVTYALYTVDEATVRQHQTEALIYTVPIVAYGLFRYLYLLHHHEVGEDTAREIFKDIHLLGTVLVWLVTVLLILGWNR
jgi:4-hydroxybenzoate polyprenyltransferase